MGGIIEQTLQRCLGLLLDGAEMAVLWIIGNGFDLQHGLKTKYTDFRDWIHEKYELGNANPKACPPVQEHLCPNYSLEDIEEKETTHNSIEIDGKAKRAFVCNMIQNVDIGAWNDLEKTLGEVDGEQFIDYFPLTGREGDLHMSAIAVLALQYAPGIKEAMGVINDDLLEWANGISLKGIGKQPTFEALFDSVESEFISFNYTRTLENIYQIPPENVLHIHGVVGDCSCDLRFGHGNLTDGHDGALYIEDAIDAYTDSTRKKFNWKGIIERDYSAVSAVVFYGFGFGEVDRKYVTILGALLPDYVPFILLHEPNSQCLISRNEYDALRMIKSRVFISETLDSIPVDLLKKIDSAV